MRHAYDIVVHWRTERNRPACGASIAFFGCYSYDIVVQTLGLLRRTFSPIMAGDARAERKNRGRNKRLIIRLNPSELALIEDAAESELISGVSTWARAALLRAAMDRLGRTRERPSERSTRVAERPRKSKD
jgi:hypothetical protein